MDLAMPALGGLAATGGSRGRRAGRVLVLTMSEDDADVFAALRAGPGLPGQGRRSRPGGERGARGRRRATRSSAPRLAGADARRSSTARPGPPPAFPELSAREQRGAEHLAEGLTNQQIAERLFISPITVRNHVSSILAKLQVTNRRQAMLRARR